MLNSLVFYIQWKMDLINVNPGQFLLLYTILYQKPIDYWTVKQIFSFNWITICLQNVFTYWKFAKNFRNVFKWLWNWVLNSEKNDFYFFSKIYSNIFSVEFFNERERHPICWLYFTSEWISSKDCVKHLKPRLSLQITIQ